MDRISREDAITPLLTLTLKELLLKEEKNNICGRIVLNKIDEYFIPYSMQFFKDYNLAGMKHVKISFDRQNGDKIKFHHILLI